MEEGDLRRILGDLRAVVREAEAAADRLSDVNKESQSTGRVREGKGFAGRNPREELYRTSGVNDHHAASMSMPVSVQLLQSNSFKKMISQSLSASAGQAMSAVKATWERVSPAESLPVHMNPAMARDVMRVASRHPADFEPLMKTLPREYRAAMLRMAPLSYQASVLFHDAVDAAKDSVQFARDSVASGIRGAGLMTGLVKPKAGFTDISRGAWHPGWKMAGGMAVGGVAAALYVVGKAVDFAAQQRNIESTYAANMIALADERSADRGMTRAAVFERISRQEGNTRKIEAYQSKFELAKSLMSATGELGTSAYIFSGKFRTAVNSFFRTSTKAGPIGVAIAGTAMAIYKAYDVVSGQEEARRDQVRQQVKGNYEKIELYMSDQRAESRIRDLHDAAIRKNGGLWAAYKYVTNLGDESAAWSEEGMRIENERWKKASTKINEGSEFMSLNDVTNARKRFDAATKELQISDFRPFMWRHPMEWFSTMESARVASRNWARSQCSRAKVRTGD